MKKNTKKCILFICCFLIIFTLFIRSRTKNMEGLADFPQLIKNAIVGIGIEPDNEELVKFNTILEETSEYVSTKYTPDGTRITNPNNNNSNLNIDSCPNAGDISITAGEGIFNGLVPSGAFCSTGNVSEKCTRLGENECNDTDCCIWTPSNTCVKGSASGPVVSTLPRMTYYSFKHKCRGECGNINIDTPSDPCYVYDETDTSISTPCIKQIWGNVYSCTVDISNSYPSLSDLSLNTKTQIWNTFNNYINAPLETNYPKCYGDLSDNVNKWPSCDKLSDNATGLSERCMKKLWRDASCDNDMGIQYFTHDAKVLDLSANNKRTIRDMFSLFAHPNASADDLKKCYGVESSNNIWPDCNKLLTVNWLRNDHVSERCMKKFFTDASCNNLAYIPLAVNDLSKNLAMTIKPKFLNMARPESPDEDLRKCYGANTNNWPNCNTIANSATNISFRCINQVFKEKGCSQDISSNFVRDNKHRTWSSIQNDLTQIYNEATTATNSNHAISRAKCFNN